MNQWLSKFRSQRIKERFKDGSWKTADEEMNWWDKPSITYLIGTLLWAATCILLWPDTGTKTGFWKLAITHTSREFFLFISTLAAGLMLHVLDPKLLRNNTKLLLLAGSALATVIPGSLLIKLGDHWPILPHAAAEMLPPYALAPLLAGVLLGGSAAIVAGLWATLACFIISNNSIPVFLSGLIATALAATWLKHIRRRTQVIRAGFLIGAFQVISLGSIVDQLPTQAVPIATLIGSSLAGGLLAGLVVLLLLPPCEALFGVTSTMTLLELSDLAHPLLQRLAFEAPGTYHHSLMVANLAQAAADEIGSNSVLARVGAYFHDIGKITKADYYTENNRSGQNPHDDLAPSMSALLVMSHIKDGITLAMLYKLPRAVIEIIQQHQGTGLVAFFHHKAGLQAQETQSTPSKSRITVEESSYRYPGPKPVSREAAIIMLADCVEAASRSLDKPTAAGIAELVDRMVDSRVEDNQLDDCEMTLEELSRVKRAFVFCLSNMLHSRIAYPKDEKRMQRVSPPGAANQDTNLRLSLTNYQRVIRLNPPALRKLAKFFLALATTRTGIAWGEISLVMVDDHRSQAINAASLGHDYPTDVITFNFDPVPGLPESLMDGEIIINVELACRLGKRYKSPAHELALYLAHGCGHLSGADDNTPSRRAQMRRRELNWIKQAEALGLLSPLFP